MKKININKKSFSTLIIIFAISAGITFQSCQNEDIDSNGEEINFEFKETSKSDIDEISNLIESNTAGKTKANKSYLSKKIKDKVDFDFNNSISHFSKDAELIVVNQKALSTDNIENTAISFIKYNGKLHRNFIIKTINVSENIKRIEYYNFNNSFVYSTTFNNNDKTITNTKNIDGLNKETVISFASKPSFSLNDLMKMQTANAECLDGGTVMDCMSDVYTNHGWLSVWVTVQTGFLPQTGAAFALACAIDSCL